jgi:hypothetical protein
VKISGEKAGKEGIAIVHTMGLSPRHILGTSKEKISTISEVTRRIGPDTLPLNSNPPPLRTFKLWEGTAL